jgi:prepilin-type N-terminal cleavage/methylation domain-containing protein
LTVSSKLTISGHGDHSGNEGVKVFCRAFTLLELVIVVLIVVVLVAITFPLVSTFRARAQRIQCTANLRNLYLGAEQFLQQNGSWPQIPRTSSTASEEYAKAWINALAPFGPSAKTWICPTIQGFLENPDYLAPENTRIDYIPMPFDDKPSTPHQWPRQPWFIETGNVHGNGNLIIFTDGSISDLNTVLQGTSTGR